MSDDHEGLNALRSALKMRLTDLGPEHLDGPSILSKASKDKGEVPIQFITDGTKEKPERSPPRRSRPRSPPRRRRSPPRRRRSPSRRKRRSRSRRRSPRRSRSRRRR